MASTFRTALPLLTPLTSLALAALLSACSNSQEARPVDANADADTVCDVARVDHLIGENISGYVERQAAQESGAGSVRVLKPGDAVTMDFDPKRLNIHVDPGKVIIKLACG